MSKIALSGNASGTGTFTIASPNSNTDRTLSLPDASGTILTTATAGVPINGPAFSAYQGTTQTISLATMTKVSFNTERFDTNSCFDTTLFRFTPSVAGYYQINVSVMFDYNVSQFSTTSLDLYKNGASIHRTTTDSVSWYGNRLLNEVVYMNGTSDYLEVYGLIAGGSGPQFLGGTTRNSFSGALIRSAT